MLGAVGGALGPALVHWVPIDTLRVVIGSLLLVFGLQWLRKAILRASGRKALHDEAQIYAEEVADLERERPAEGFDWTAFTVAFKGVFLEGLEVAFIVLTFGANHGSYGLTIAGATVGLVLVVGTGLVVHRPLARVPENHIKFAVGVMLSAFGTFWAGEGVGIDWSFSDGMLLFLVGLYIAAAIVAVAVMRRRPTRRVTRTAEAVAP
jgi:uncharacterized membrane protein